MSDEIRVDERVPEHLRGGLERYINRGIQPGHFLTAVLENNLMEAMGRSDETSRDGLFGLCGWLYNEAPCGCHGSPEKVRKWIKSKGLSAANLQSPPVPSGSIYTPDSDAENEAKPT
jgi:hypothetical protein